MAASARVDLELRQRVGERMRNRRKALGLTAEALAAMVGINRVTIAKFETGRQSLTIEVYYALVTALGVEPDPLMRAELCATCQGLPPLGFTCQRCGATGAAP
jgi:UDP-N-acetylglucosamine 1-carboxyvinyltransferase